jgi:hypothetical protein
MKGIHKIKTSEISRNINFDALCQEFDGGSFYGLEYILEDFFRNITVKPSVPAVLPSIGLGCTTSGLFNFTKANHE